MPHISWTTPERQVQLCEMLGFANRSFSNADRDWGSWATCLKLSHLIVDEPVIDCQWRPTFTLGCWQDSPTESCQLKSSLVCIEMCTLWRAPAFLSCHSLPAKVVELCDARGCSTDARHLATWHLSRSRFRRSHRSDFSTCHGNPKHSPSGWFISGLDQVSNQLLLSPTKWTPEVISYVIIPVSYVITRGNIFYKFVNLMSRYK